MSIGVPEHQLGSLGACGDLHSLGGAVQHISLYRLDLPRGNGGAGFQPLNDDFARRVGVEYTVAGADRRAAAVCDLERHASQRFIVGALDVLADGEGHGGVVLKGKAIAGAGSRTARIAPVAAGAAGQGVPAVCHGDDLRGGIQHIAIGNLYLSDYIGVSRNKAGDSHGAVRAGGIAAYDISAAVLDLKNRSGDRLAGDGIQLGDRQSAEGFIEECEGLCVHGVDRDSLGLSGCVNDIAGSGLDLLDHHGSDDTGNADFALRVRGIEAIGGQMPVVLIHISAVGILCPRLLNGKTY